MTDKQCSSCGGDCGKVCERENVAGLCNKWIIEALQRDDFVHVKDNAFLRLKSIGGLTLIAELKARWVRNHLIKEPPNFPPEVVEPYNGWILRKVYFEDGEPLMHSEPESQELAESPNSATDVVEPEEPLCYLQEIDTLGGAYEQVAWGEGFPVYTAPQNMDVEIKRLQELADYRLKLLTKMPSEWVGLTDEDMEGMFLNAEGIRIARYIETRLKGMNNA